MYKLLHMIWVLYSATHSLQSFVHQHHHTFSIGPQESFFSFTIGMLAEWITNISFTFPPCLMGPYQSSQVPASIEPQKLQVYQVSSLWLPETFKLTSIVLWVLWSLWLALDSVRSSPAFFWNPVWRCKDLTGFSPNLGIMAFLVWCFNDFFSANTNNKDSETWKRLIVVCKYQLS